MLDKIAVILLLGVFSVNAFGYPGYPLQGCRENLCKNGATCVERNTTWSFKCVCPAGFLGTQCEVHETDPCASGNYCLNKGRCYSYKYGGIEKGYRANCYCQTDYYGERCEKKHPCLENVCQNGAKCSKKYNYKTNGNYQCTCKKGFEGVNCDIISPNLCGQNPCKNNGQCYQYRNVTTSISAYMCICPEGKTGKNCDQTSEDPCAVNPCQNNGICTPFDDTQFFCKCPIYTFGDRCQLTSPCAKNYCNGNGFCIPEFFNNNHYGNKNTAVCKCLPQYGGKRCETINPCFEKNPCKNGGKCISSIRYNYTSSGQKFGGFSKPTCICSENFGGKYCETLSPCLTENPCKNDAQCLVVRQYYGAKFYKPNCLCPLDYEGPYCNIKKFDPCEENMCKNGATCVPHKYIRESYNCICPKMFSGKECENEITKFSIMKYNFEYTSSDFTVEATTSYKWLIARGSTRSPGTGPSKAHEGDKYIYTEASSPAQEGDTTRILSKFIEIEESACLSFYYHMLGTGIGELQVTVENRDGEVVGEEWKVSGQKGDVWNKKEIELGSGEQRLVITGTRGSSWSGDIALDDLNLTNGSCKTDDTEPIET